MKKILVIGDSDVFVKRFVEYFSFRGYEVCLLTFAPIVEEINVNVIVMPYKRPYGGFLNILFARRIVRSFRPDLLHVFSGGVDALLGSFLNHRPSILNVYGTEIFDVPMKSFFHKYLIRRNLLYYDRICSTSRIMASRTEKLILNKRSVHVTPFGVDLKEFSKNDFSKGNENTIVIGTVKRLKKKYGIDTLIKAFHQVKNRLIGQTNLDLKLVIVGNGSEMESLIRLSYDLGLGDDVEFVGHVPNKLVKTYLNKMDIFVALSRLESESFGVAIVEASAMRVPVVCSNIGGIPEVVVDGETGFLVEVDNVNVAADRILELVLDKELRMQMGNSGRKFIESTYGFEDNADIILNIYSEMLNGIE